MNLASPIGADLASARFNPSGCCLCPVGQSMPGHSLCSSQSTPQTLVWRDALTGAEKNTCSLTGPATWLGQQADLVIAAGPRHVQGLQALRGTELGRMWEFAIEGGRAGRLSTECFAVVFHGAGPTPVGARRRDGPGPGGTAAGSAWCTPDRRLRPVASIQTTAPTRRSQESAPPPAAAGSSVRRAVERSSRRAITAYPGRSRHCR